MSLFPLNNCQTCLVSLSTNCSLSAPHVSVCAALETTVIRNRLWALAVRPELQAPLNWGEKKNSLLMFWWQTGERVRSWTIGQPQSKPPKPPKIWSSETRTATLQLAQCVCCKAPVGSAKFPGTISLFSLWFFSPAETTDEVLQNVEHSKLWTEALNHTRTSITNSALTDLNHYDPVSVSGCRPVIDPPGTLLNSGGSQTCELILLESFSFPSCVCVSPRRKSAALWLTASVWLTAGCVLMMAEER